MTWYLTQIPDTRPDPKYFINTRTRPDPKLKNPTRLTLLAGRWRKVRKNWRRASIPIEHSRQSSSAGILTIPKRAARCQTEDATKKLTNANTITFYKQIQTQGKTDARGPKSSQRADATKNAKSDTNLNQILQ